MNRTRWILLAAALLAVVAGSAFVLLQGSSVEAQEGSQPIAFPHDLHAGGTNNIPCMYCHYTADRSEDAGIPPVQLCAGCHIPGGVPMVATDRPGVEKLVEYWTEQQPIPWNRIYKLPDHAHFPHMMHVNAEIECQECHGQVQEMTEVEMVAPMTMGWCLDCHQQRDVRIDCFVCHY